MDSRFVKGTVVGAVGATVLVLTGAAFAGTGIGAAFNLGRTNTVNAQSTLKGATSGKNLQITNTGHGRGLGISVGSGQAPITVNKSAGKATNLNADELDGHSSGYFGVRAYGLVSRDGTNVTRSKNIVSVSNPASGTYCIALAPSIDATTTVPIVSPDFMQDDTNVGTNAPQTFAEYDGEDVCADPGTLEIVTGVRTVTTAGSPDGDVRAVTDTLSNEGFTIVVP